MVNQTKSIACINSFYISLVYKLFFLSVCGYGLLLHISPVSIDYNVHMFSYFTVLSNSLCFIMTFIYIIKGLKIRRSTLRHHTDNTFLSIYTKRYTFFKGMSLMAIILTFIIYHFMVAKYKYPLLYNNILTLPAKDLTAHYVVPLLYIFDWLLFQPKNLNTIKSPLHWMVYPFIYLATIMFRAFWMPKESVLYLTEFPYFFLDIKELGFIKFSIFIILIVIVIIAIGYSILGIEKLMCRISRRR